MRRLQMYGNHTKITLKREILFFISIPNILVKNKRKLLKTIGLLKQPPKVFYKKVVLNNFAKFTGKHLCQSLFFHKVAGLRPATLLKKRL